MGDKLVFDELAVRVGFIGSTQYSRHLVVDEITSVLREDNWITQHYVPKAYHFRQGFSGLCQWISEELRLGQQEMTRRNRLIITDNAPKTYRDLLRHISSELSPQEVSDLAVINQYDIVFDLTFLCGSSVDHYDLDELEKEYPNTVFGRPTSIESICQTIHSFIDGSEAIVV